MNFLNYEAEKKKLQEQNLTPNEYEEEIKRLVEKLEREEEQRWNMKNWKTKAVRLTKISILRYYKCPLKRFKSKIGINYHKRNLRGVKRDFKGSKEWQN